MKDRLEESEKLIQEMTITWEEKLRKTEEIAQVESCLINQMELQNNIFPRFMYLIIYFLHFAELASILGPGLYTV